MQCGILGDCQVVFGFGVALRIYQGHDVGFFHIKYILFYRFYTYFVCLGCFILVIIGSFVDMGEGSRIGHWF